MMGEKLLLRKFRLKIYVKISPIVLEEIFRNIFKMVITLVMGDGLQRKVEKEARCMSACCKQCENNQRHLLKKFKFE